MVDGNPKLQIAQLCLELVFCIYILVAICWAQKKREIQKRQVETDESELVEYEKLPEKQENEKLIGQVEQEKLPNQMEFENQTAPENDNRRGLSSSSINNLIPDTSAFGASMESSMSNQKVDELIALNRQETSL